METIANILNQAVREKTFPGAVVGVVTTSGERSIIAAGRFTYESESPPMNEETVFDVASVTKAIPTSLLTLKLIEKKKITLDSKVIKYIPEFKNRDRDMVTVWHLLTQTLVWDFHLSAQKDKTAQEIMRLILESPFTARPGERVLWTNHASILLGLLVERVMEKSLDVLAEEYIFQPLGMRQTTFKPLEHFPKERIAPTEIDAWRGRVIQGEVHDESASILQTMMVPGSAGLFSITPDLLNVLEMLLGGGQYRGKEIFHPDTIKLMHTNQCGPEDPIGLGWELAQPHFMGSHFTPETFGKTGFTGVSVLVDRSKDVGLVILSNATYPKRPENKQAINRVRQQIADVVLGQK